MAIVLVPKRKMIASLGEDTDSVATAIDSIQSGVSGGIPEVVDRLTVRKRLKIPVGTDMYD